MAKKKVLFNVEEKTYRNFKSLCASKGIKISEMVEKLMEGVTKTMAKKK